MAINFMRSARHVIDTCTTSPMNKLNLMSNPRDRETPPDSWWVVVCGWFMVGGSLTQNSWEHTHTQQGDYGVSEHIMASDKPNKSFIDQVVQPRRSRINPASFCREVRCRDDPRSIDSQQKACEVFQLRTSIFSCATSLESLPTFTGGTCQTGTFNH